MKTEINFASHVQKTKKGISRFTLVGVGILALTLFASLGLFLYILVLSSKSNSLDTQTSQLQNTLTQMGQQKGKALVLEERLSSIDKILSTRLDFNSALQKILDALPDSVGIESVTSDPSHIKLAITSPNLADMNSLMEDKLLFVSNHSLKQFKMITLDSFVSDPTTQLYNAAIDIQIGP